MDETPWIDYELQEDEAELFTTVISQYYAKEIPWEVYMLWNRRAYLPAKIEEEPGNEKLIEHVHNCRKYGKTYLENL